MAFSSDAHDEQIAHPPLAGSTGDGYRASEFPERRRKGFGPSKNSGTMDDPEDSIDGGSMKPVSDHTHRKLKPRHIQLIGIGGTIGTALYVQIGEGLLHGGPASLFLAFTLWLVVIASLSNFYLLFVSLLCWNTEKCGADSCTKVGFKVSYGLNLSGRC